MYKLNYKFKLQINLASTATKSVFLKMADFAPSKAATEQVEDSAKLFDKSWESIQKKSMNSAIHKDSLYQLDK